MTASDKNPDEVKRKRNIITKTPNSTGIGHKSIRSRCLAGRMQPTKMMRGPSEAPHPKPD
jgi:hypothetical protein